MVYRDRVQRKQAQTPRVRRQTGPDHRCSIQEEGQVAATQGTDPVPAPFRTEREAAAMVEHITDSPAGSGAWRDGCHGLLEDTCRAAGVDLGTYDEQVLLWLADGEPPTVAVIAGLIRRAHAAGLEDGRDVLNA